MNHSPYLERPHRSRAEIAAECRDAAEIYEREAARAAKSGNAKAADAFRRLADERRERARQLEAH